MSLSALRTWMVDSSPSSVRAREVPFALGGCPLPSRVPSDRPTLLRTRKERKERSSNALLGRKPPSPEPESASESETRQN